MTRAHRFYNAQIHRFRPSALSCSFLILIMGISPVLSQTWEIEVVEYCKNFSGSSGTNKSLRVDANGHSHIVYGHDRLYYAFHDGLDWHYEIADPDEGVGRQASLSLDASGSPCVCYRDDTNDRLKYAYRDATGWHTEVIDSSSTNNPALVLDVAGSPHVGYEHYPIGLMHACRDASGWHLEVVDSVTPYYSISLAMDASGYPHFSYNDPDLDCLIYAYRTSSGWSFEIVDSDDPFGCTSLMLDVTGYPHISYQNSAGNPDLAYARRDAAGWHLETVDAQGSTGYSSSLALDSSGHTHIAYGWFSYDAAPDGDIRYALRDGSGWHIETADTTGHIVGASLGLDPNGNPHISYRISPNQYGVLAHGHRDASGWHTETVDVSGYVINPSLVVDWGGNPHVCYSVGLYAPQPVMRYSHWSPAGWSTETIDAEGRGLAFFSMSLDSSEYPHISYYDDTNHNLEYAHRDESGWHMEIVDDWGNSGKYSSLALDTLDFPHISYYEEYFHDLRYAYKDGAGWHIELVDEPEEVGEYSSLALDGSGHPHIGYYESYPDYDLKYAFHDGSVWHYETVDAAGRVGRYLSLALDGFGYPHLSYHDYHPNYDLKYAYRDASGWHIEVVDAAGDVGVGSRIAVDLLDHPHIIYLSYEDGLKYARRDASGWHFEIVDPECPWGWSWGYGLPRFSLRLDPWGRPHIFYLSRDLMYAYLPNIPEIPIDATASEGSIALTWGLVPDAEAFWVYGASNQPWFIPGTGPEYAYRLTILPPTETNWSGSNGIGDPQSDWCFLVIAVDAEEQTLGMSNRVGEADFEGDIP